MHSTFVTDIAANDANRAILSRWPRLGLPHAWLVAGCLFQTVWNLKSGKPPSQGMKDCDLFYFDAADLSKAGEAQAQAHADAVPCDLSDRQSAGPACRSFRAQGGQLPTALALAQADPGRERPSLRKLLTSLLAGSP